MSKNEIELGKGILGITFEMQRSEVEKILGKADDEAEYILSQQESSLTLLYQTIGLSFTFESVDQDRLSYISVLNDQYKLFQFIKVGLSKQILLSEIEHFQLGDPEFKDISSEEFPTHELLFFPNQNLHIWFDNDVISEIQFGPFWENTKTIIWETT